MNNLIYKVRHRSNDDDSRIEQPHFLITKEDLWTGEALDGRKIIKPENVEGALAELMHWPALSAL
jgi:hypothetical protein